MRRVLTFITTCALLVASLGIGVFMADLPFWRRALQLPLPPDAAYLPVAPLGSPESAPLAPAAAQRLSIDAVALDAAAHMAQGSGARALLVMHHGRTQLERYFAAADAHAMLPADLFARPLAALAVGVALAEGHLDSLDVPVARYLPEWDGEARGRITLRQLLHEVSGLETGPHPLASLTVDPFSGPAHLVAFATSKSYRLLLGNDLESIALGFQLEHEPGGFFNVSPVNTQLVAVMIERSSGMPYEHFVHDRIWRRVHAGAAELHMDRRSGMPAAHCCLRAAARDLLLVAQLLANDGVHGDERIIPAGWVREMAAGSRANPEFGLQLQVTRVEELEVLSAEDAHGSALWAVPAKGLTILHLGGRGGSAAPQIPAMLIKAIKEP